MSLSLFLSFLPIPSFLPDPSPPPPPLPPPLLFNVLFSYGFLDFETIDKITKAFSAIAKPKDEDQADSSTLVDAPTKGHELPLTFLFIYFFLL